MDRLNEPSTSECGQGDQGSSTGVSSCSQESIENEASSSTSTTSGEEQASEDSAVGGSVAEQVTDGAGADVVSESEGAKIKEEEATENGDDADEGDKDRIATGK